MGLVAASYLGTCWPGTSLFWWQELTYDLNTPVVFRIFPMALPAEVSSLVASIGTTQNFQDSPGSCSKISIRSMRWFIGSDFEPLLTPLGILRKVAIKNYDLDLLDDSQRQVIGRFFVVHRLCIISDCWQVVQRKAQIKIACFNLFHHSEQTFFLLRRPATEAASARWTGGLFESGSSAHCAAPLCSLERWISEWWGFHQWGYPSSQRMVNRSGRNPIVR